MEVAPSIMTASDTCCALDVAGCFRPPALHAKGLNHAKGKVACAFIGIFCAGLIDAMCNIAASANEHHPCCDDRTEVWHCWGGLQASMPCFT